MAANAMGSGAQAPRAGGSRRLSLSKRVFPLGRRAAAVGPGRVNPARWDLPYLDGLRGLSALAVVCFHAYLFSGTTAHTMADKPAAAWVFGYGYLGVSVFIVLSGYVLMLPLASRQVLAYPRGTRDYFRRRARRIVPPYFACLAVSLLLIFSVPLLRAPGGTQWDNKLPVTFASVVAHVTLTHDLSLDWISRINGPLWSVAVECQIYIAMAFALLPLRRRVPGPVLVAIATAAGLLLASSPTGYAAHPWFLGLFAAGMYAAERTVDPGNRSTRAMGFIATAACVAAVAILVALRLMGHASLWLSELSVGLATAVVLVWLSLVTVEGQSSRIVKILTFRPILLLGLTSYSVYLMHSPLLALGNLLLLKLNIGPWALLAGELLLVVPLALVVCFGFYHVVERRFRNTHQRRTSLDGGI